MASALTHRRRDATCASLPNVLDVGTVAPTTTTTLILVSMVVPAMLLFLWFGLWIGKEVSPISWALPLATGWVHGEWIGCGETDLTSVLQVSGFDMVTPWWHLAYLASLAVLLVTIAVLRHRRDRPALLAFGLALAATILLAVVQASFFEPYQAVT